MPDPATDALIVGALLAAGTVAVGEITKPKMPGVPSPGPSPGPVPNPNQAAADAASLRQRQLQRRTLDSLRIDTPSTQGPGIQIPRS